MSGSGFRSGSTRSIAAPKIRATKGVEPLCLRERVPGLRARRDRGEVVPELPVAAVLGDRLAIVGARRACVATCRLDVSELPPGVGRPAPPAGSLAGLRRGLVVSA